jgi:hypothetical protein
MTACKPSWAAIVARGQLAREGAPRALAPEGGDLDAWALPDLEASEPVRAGIRNHPDHADVPVEALADGADEPRGRFGEGFRKRQDAGDRVLGDQAALRLPPVGLEAG